ncbi:MAG: hypothetical protein U0414_39260 [Polyangiaceae bacterium]
MMAVSKRFHVRAEGAPTLRRASARYLVGVATACALLASAACDDGGGTGGAGGTGTSASTGSKGTTTGSSTSTTSTTTGTTSGSTVGSSSSGMIMGAFDCLGDPLPTTAPAVIDLGGDVSGIDGASTSKVMGAKVELFKNDVLASTTTSGAMGVFSFLDVATNGMPVDGYLRASDPKFLDTYVYPPYPLAKDTPNAAVLLVSPSTITLLSMIGLPAQNPQNAFVGILVVDCDGNPVEGATVSTNPPGTVKYGMGMLPSNSATSTGADGLAYVFNVPAGPVVVDAMAGTNDLREHTIQGRAGVITTTIVAP